MYNPNKVSTTPNNFSTEHIYRFYVESLLIDHPTWTSKRKGHIAKGEVFNEEGKLVISYKTFKTVLAAVNTTFGEKLIKGYVMDLLNKLGDLYIARIERNPNNLKLNYLESKRLKKKLAEEGEELTETNWRVYYTDDEYIRLKHHKPGFLRNLRFYHFKTAGGQNGYRRKMSRDIQATPTLKALYPLIRYN